MSNLKDKDYNILEAEILKEFGDNLKENGEKSEEIIFKDENVITNDDFDEKGELKRAIRIPSNRIEISYIPEPNESTIKVADYFKLRYSEGKSLSGICSEDELKDSALWTHSENIKSIIHYGDILYMIQRDNMELERYDMTKLVNNWLIRQNKFIGNEKWLSCSFIGASKYAVSSKSRVYEIERRRLLVPRKPGINLDNGVRKGISRYNLSCSAFYKFPIIPDSTCDHRNRISDDDEVENLSFESKSVQNFNRSMPVKKGHSRPIVRFDLDKTTIIKKWSSLKDAVADTGFPEKKLILLCSNFAKYENSFWKYDDLELLPGEIFEPIPIEGLGKFNISNFGRRMTLSTGQISDGYINRRGYISTSFRNSILNKDKYYLIHILVALTFVTNTNPDKFNIVHHIDNNKSNPTSDNLEWTDISGNQTYAYEVEHKIKVSVIHKNKKGDVLGEYSSMMDAVRETGIPYDYIMYPRWVNHLGEETIFERKGEKYTDDRCGNGIPVVQLDYNATKVLFIWSSSRKAESLTGICNTIISGCINGTRDTGGGFKWRRLTIDEVPYKTESIVNLDDLKTKMCQTNRIHEINPQTGMIISTFTLSRRTPETSEFSDEKMAEMCKGWKKSHRYFLYEREYLRRIENNEQVVQPILHDIDFENIPIVTLNLEGDVLFISNNIRETVLKLNRRYVGNLILTVAKEVKATREHYRFAFKFVYDKNPKSYKIMNTNLLKAIKKRDSYVPPVVSDTNGFFIKTALEKLDRAHLRSLALENGTSTDGSREHMIHHLMMKKGQPSVQMVVIYPKLEIVYPMAPKIINPILQIIS